MEPTHHPKSQVTQRCWDTLYILLSLTPDLVENKEILVYDWQSRDLNNKLLLVVYLVQSVPATHSPSIGVVILKVQTQVHRNASYISGIN